MPKALYDIENTVNQIVIGKPDAITMQIGIAKKVWINHAGLIPLILQSSLARPDDTANETIASVEDALILGAEAIAVTAFIRGESESKNLNAVAKLVKEAQYFDLPLICHIYPRDYSNTIPTISFKPEDIAWAVHCALEVGADIIKVPYCDDVQTFKEIVNQTPVPVIAAGGPKQETVKSALELIADVMKCGSKGATVGRNVWGSRKIVEVIRAFKSVVHDGDSVNESLAKAGLSE